MIDFHMHVLPGMDDGSRNIFVSLAMLEKSAEQGIKTVAATSHFYAQENSPKQFLERRQRAADILMDAMEDEDWTPPRILLGAEVHFFDGMSAVSDLDKLCLEGTNFLLLEMPFVRWTDRMLREVDELIRRGIEPVAAHIERYMHIQSEKTMKAFLDKDILVQTNANFFIFRKTERRALKMLKNARIQFLGSDAHNITSRPPNLGYARDIVEKKLGGPALSYLRSYETLATRGGGAE